MPVSSLQSTDGGDNDMKFENSYDDDSTTNSHIIFGNSSIIDYRIASCFGYTCGMSIDNPGERYLGEDPQQCVCAYDIESAYSPYVLCSDHGYLICASVVCSCGWDVKISSMRAQ